MDPRSGEVLCEFRAVVYVSQFYATSLEGPEESQFDENYLIEFNVIGEFDKINYLSVPGKGITAPIEVITSEISMNHPDEKVKTIARLIKKERR